MGGVRAQFATPVNIQMSLYSIPFYASFDERLGYPAVIGRRDIYSGDQADAPGVFAGNQQKQNRYGPEERPMVDRRRNRQRCSRNSAGDDIVGGSFCSTDGFVDPYLRHERLHVLGR